MNKGLKAQPAVSFSHPLNPLLYSSPFLLNLFSPSLPLPQTELDQNHARERTPPQMRCEDFPNALQRPSLLFPTQSFFNELKASFGSSRQWHKADKELHRTTVDSALLAPR